MCIGGIITLSIVGVLLFVVTPLFVIAVAQDGWGYRHRAKKFRKNFPHINSIVDEYLGKNKELHTRQSEILNALNANTERCKKLDERLKYLPTTDEKYNDFATEYNKLQNENDELNIKLKNIEKEFKLLETNEYQMAEMIWNRKVNWNFIIDIENKDDK